MLKKYIKSPVNKCPLQVLQWEPYRQSCLFPGPSFMCLSDSSIKVLLTENLTLLAKPLGKERPLYVSQSRAPIEIDACFYSCT
jgi:hypothetical protein